jgi:hypothetical protein
VRDYSFSILSEIAAEPREDYIRNATMSMESRFSHFIVTPEQQKAWNIGFSWIYDLADSLSQIASSWILLPEFSAPLVSGRPDLVILTNRYLLVVEMKTGVKSVGNSGKRQVLEYAVTMWGKLKSSRSRVVLPILLSAKGSKQPKNFAIKLEAIVEPESAISLNPSDLNSLLLTIANAEAGAFLDFEAEKELLLYSPRPSVVEAATALVAATSDKNIITGLSNEDELSRISNIIQKIGVQASQNLEKRIVVVAGPPGAGKTLVGLRMAHDPKLQKLIPDSVGTPLYLTGNGPLVDVLVESLARDEVRRMGSSKPVARSNAEAKVRSIHGITEKKLGIESNVIIFDEGQRIWTAEHMRRKKGDSSLGSEAEEVLSYLEKRDWALVVVLLGEGQEINTGEEGIDTWIDAVVQRNLTSGANWRITIPDGVDLGSYSQALEIEPSLRLKVVRRTDNAADVAGWVSALLNFKISDALHARSRFLDFPIFITRDLDQARDWILNQVETCGGTSGLLASSRSKRLFRYGLDTVADANRSFSWENWYLNRRPDLNSSEALEVVATEYKCQGLELDWVGVCWSWDLIPSGESWLPRNLNSGSAKWRTTSKKAQYQINAYRVLLTRSRKGMVIWIPSGMDGDASMLPTEMDKVAEVLISAGAKYLPSLPLPNVN